MSGISTRSTLRALALGAIAALPAVPVSQAIALEIPPAPQDARLAAALQEARALFEKASSSGYLDMPTGGSWPCEVSELQVRRLAYALSDDEQDDKYRRMMNSVFLNAGMNRKDIKTAIRDVRFAPVAAGCKDGRLDGPVEFVIEYTRRTDMPTVISEIRTRSRLRMELAGGEPVASAPSTTASVQLSMKMTYKDPATQAMMQNVKTPESSSIMVRYAVNEAAAPYNATIVETRTGSDAPQWMTMFTRPLAPNRTEGTMYRGAELFQVNRMKNGLMHGESKTFPAKFGTVLVPGQTRCYEDGEEIKTTQCDVD